MGPKVLFIRILIYLGRGLDRLERACSPTNKRTITNVLRTKAYFIVGIMDKYIDRCYIFIHIIFD